MWQTDFPGFYKREKDLPVQVLFPLNRTPYFGSTCQAALGICIQAGAGSTTRVFRL